MSFERRDIVDIRRQPGEDPYDHFVRGIGILTHFWFEFLQWAIVVGGLGYLGIKTKMFVLIVAALVSELFLIAYCFTFGARFECDALFGHEMGGKVTSLIIGGFTACLINTIAVAIYFSIHIAKGLP
jgi:predicted alpha/beta-hydrolase family hydrolase